MNFVEFVTQISNTHEKLVILSPEGLYFSNSEQNRDVRDPLQPHQSLKNKETK